MEFTFGSWGAGIGGLDLGLERAGWHCRWQVEKDPYCQKVLARHWPEVKRYGDSYDVDYTKLERVDLICAGFPCQPVSHAGRRQGERDDRWLWPEVLRAVRALRPSLFLGENVYGLVTHQQGLLLEGIYTDLEAAGYETAPPVVFPAAALGAPHRRDRVWICAHANSERVPDHRSRQAISPTREIESSKEEREWLRAVSGQLDHDHNRSASCPNANSDSSDRNRWNCDVQMGWGRFPQNATSILFGAGDQWGIEPAVGRVAYGVPSLLDRNGALGNAVVPACAELLGRVLKGTV